MAAQGPLPAGMLRIRQGSQERYVWPVHLPGWLGLGWRVAGAEAPSVGIDAADPPAPITAAVGDLLEQDDPKPASNRSRRGRRRKEEPEQPPAGAETTPEETGTTAEADAADSVPMAAPDSTAEADTTPGGDSTADGGEALSALPDDLFDDPLI
jgi:hypothetical protein